MAHSDKGFAAATTAVPALATATDPMAGMERDIRDAAVASVRAAFTGDQTKATEASNPAADAIAKAQNHEQHIEVLFPKQSSRLPKLPKRPRPQFRPVRSWGSSPSQCRMDRRFGWHHPPHPRRRHIRRPLLGRSPIRRYFQDKCFALTNCAFNFAVSSPSWMKDRACFESATLSSHRFLQIAVFNERSLSTMLVEKDSNVT